MNKQLIAHGEATVRLTNKKTGRVVREITARNKLNSDYVAECKNNLFSPTSALTLFLSDYELPSPDNGLIFPMGRFLGHGKYNSGSSSAHQGVWNAVNSKVNDQKNGLTTSTFSWDFTPQQAVGTLRSLFLFWEGTINRQPMIYNPITVWKGLPRCSFESVLYDNVAKTTTEYYVGDMYTKTVSLRTKANTILTSGLAYDLDTGHLYVFDADAKKLYKFASINVELTTANILAEYPCTKAYFSRGFIRNGNLFYVSSSNNPATTTNVSSFTGTTVYLYKYAFATDSVPDLADTMTCAEMGYSGFGYNLTATYMDDFLVLGYQSSGSGYCSLVMRFVGNNVRLGITGASAVTTSLIQQRPSKNKQLIITGSPTTVSYNQIQPMAISHLLMPVPFVKDNAHGMSVSYTISIQE